MRRVAVTLAAALAPTAALACPVCFDAAPGDVIRFYSISTMMLSFLPFAAVGLGALVAWHYARPGQDEDRAAATPAQLTPRR